MLRDVRYAARYLWTHKGFTAAAVLTLAIGLGANTAFYGVLNSTLRPRSGGSRQLASGARTQSTRFVGDHPDPDVRVEQHDSLVGVALVGAPGCGNGIHRPVVLEPRAPHRTHR